MLKNVHVGCGSITWIEQTETGKGLSAPESQVLSEIAQAGYGGAPTGPKAGQSTAERMAFFAEHGLKIAPGYLGASFWDAAQRDDILDKARGLAQFMHEAGCSEVYVAASGMDFVGRRGKRRNEVAGQVTAEDGMSDTEYQQFADTLTHVGEVMLAEGIRACFHNHVGTVIETRQEIDRLFAMVNRDVVFMGPDTGHLAWGGVDVVEFFRDYADSIKTVHLKDIHRHVMDQGRAEAWDYRTFADNGIFAELGEGFIDFPAIFQILKDAGFEGWLITETDVTQKPTALESVTISRDYLKGLGI